MEAVKLETPLRVEEVSDRAGFVALEEAWNSLVGEVDDQPFYRHAFFRVWIDNFAPKERVRVLIARDGAGVLAAVLPLVERRTLLYGVPIVELSAAANSHSCRFDLVARDGAAAARAFIAHLAERPGWDVLRLGDVPEGGRAWHLLEAAREAGHPVGTWESLRSPYVPLPERFEALQAGLASRFKANLRRRRRKLQERGEVRIERLQGGLSLEARLEEGFALEQRGWKGARGTAIGQDRATRGFYSELARELSGGGGLALTFLRLDGRAVGFHYALEHGGRSFLLKPAYDEALGDCSPGQLLLEDVLQGCVDRGISEFDFLGPDMPWKRDWTDRVRVHTWLYVFGRSGLGRALRRAKFSWVPAAKEALERWKR